MLQGTPEQQRAMYEIEDAVVCESCLEDLRRAGRGQGAHEIMLDLPGDSRCCHLCHYERVTKWSEIEATHAMIVQVLEEMRREILRYMVVSREMIDDYASDGRPPSERSDPRGRGEATA